MMKVEGGKEGNEQQILFSYKRKKLRTQEYCAHFPRSQAPRQQYPPGGAWLQF
jgi:hypothetical protein